MSKFRIEINNILHKLQKGDTSLQEILFYKTYNYLKVIAFKYTYNKNDIEDVIIDAYVRIYQYIHTFNRLKDGYNWMCKIVQNVAYGFNKESGVVQYVENDSGIFGKYCEALENKWALMQELARLEKNDQQLIFLKYWENLTCREIARKLKMSKSTVHRRILGILEILRKKLQ